ncbi:MAG: DUF4349 domain-containing protein [Bacteroidetes bacterium]|nr:DUF4349 domain-containing protein [Bacteroidota bacterium]
MKSNLVLLVLFFALSASGQPEKSFLSQKMDISLEIMNLPEAEAKLNDLIVSQKAIVDESSRNSSYSNSKSLSMTLRVDQSAFEFFRTALPALGSVRKNLITTTDNQKEYESLVMELNYLKKQRDIFQTEFQTINKEMNKTAYENFWNKLREFDQRIFDTEKLILNKEQQTRNFIVQVSLDEQHSEPMDSAWPEFINMPGVESVVLKIDNPKSNLSAGWYNGAGIRYMFTKGKSYITLSVLKAYDIAADDSTGIRDVLMYGYGVDFYSRYFGRGQNQWFNLYSGMVFGGGFMTSKSKKLEIGFITPHIGLEIFKNQYVVLDARLGYFVPLTKAYNLNLRGLTNNLSLNFVF